MTHNASGFSSDIQLDQMIESGLKRLASKVEFRRKSKRVVYSGSVGSYDAMYKLNHKDPDTDYLFFSDHDEPNDLGWSTIKIDFTYRTEQRTAKILKLLPHLFLTEYEESIWIDANRRVTGSLWPIYEKFSTDFRLFAHPKRGSIFVEAEECIKWSKDEPQLIRSQIAKYRDEGFRDDVPLLSGAVLYRKHNVETVRHLMESWWAEVDENCVRDQLSLPPTIWRSKFSYDVVDGNVNEHPAFETISHVRPYANDGSLKGRMLSAFAFILGKIRARLK